MTPILKYHLNVYVHTTGAVEMEDAHGMEYLGRVPKEFLYEFYQDVTNLPIDCIGNDVLALMIHYNTNPPK
jgi:hypothetical protein